MFPLRERGEGLKERHSRNQFRTAATAVKACPASSDKCLSDTLGSPKTRELGRLAAQIENAHKSRMVLAC